MIGVNMQTSFLTPPFGFALFYLRGVAPPDITMRDIYAAVTPFVLLEIGILAFFLDDPAYQMAAAVAGHHHDRVGKVHHASMAIGKPTIVK